jgi:hypothetical protein
MEVEEINIIEIPLIEPNYSDEDIYGNFNNRFRRSSL